MRYLRFVLAALALGVLVVACTPTSDSTLPTVTLTAPVDGTAVTAGDTVTIEGAAADNVGVTRVLVTIGEDYVRVAEGTTTWSVDWTPNAAGDYTISAQAFDAAGNASEASATVTVTVEEAVPAPTTGGVVGVITRTAPAPEPPVGPDSLFGRNIDFSVNAEGFASAGTLAPVVPGEVFVVFKQGRPQPVFGATGDQPVTVGEFTFSSNGNFSFQGTAFEQARVYRMGTGLALYRADVASEAATRDLVNSLRAQDLVQEAFPNWILSANQLYPDDQYYGLQGWHYEQLNLPEAWDIETGDSTRATVAILDTGRYDHPDMEWAEPGANFVGWTCTGPGVCAPDVAEGPIDNEFTNPGGSSHGTHVGGTVGAVTNNGTGVAGVNWNVDVLPVKVLGASGSGSLAGIIEGMFWAAGVPDDIYGGHDNENPAWVMNLSLGGNISEACPAAIDAYIGLFAEFMGTITVVSAGNDASPSDVYFPANCPSAITVGATGPTGARSYYSSYGAFVDVMAPGGDADYDHPVMGSAAYAGVLSTSVNAVGAPGYSFMQGTSMAAPHVTGVVSLMLAADPTLSLDEVRERLHNASVPLTLAQCNVPGVGFDGQNVCGAGLLDAAAALLGATVTTPTATAYAIRYEGEDAPAIGIGNLSSLELFASNVAVATANLAGDYEFEFTDLEPGNYLLVGLEQRAPETGVSNIDRVGFVEAVEVVAGENELVTIVVNSIYSSLR